MKRSTIVLASVAAVLVLIGMSLVGGYNELIALDQSVSSQWAQVENVYQRRADLVPNLVETVKGAANFERGTLTDVTEARSQVGKLSVGKDALEDPQVFQRFQQAQDKLSGALSRLLAVSEAYPELRATQNFRDLQAQLEGTENRITVERQRFNEAAQAFNTKRNTFPTVLLANFFGTRFKEKPYFKARAGSEAAPQVKF